MREFVTRFELLTERDFFLQTHCLIVGQGLAGTALAWQLRWRSIPFLVVDRDEAVTASRIAAGLITPVTGQRVVPAWRLSEFLPAAETFYRRAGLELGDGVLFPRGAVRLFASDSEARRFHQRDLTAMPGLVEAINPPLDSTCFETAGGGFQMPGASQLSVARFLDASRKLFQRDGCWREGGIDPARDLELSRDRVRLPRLGICSQCVVFCEGFAASRNPWLSSLKFDATRGEILTVRVPGLREQRIVNRGVWLAPSGEPELFRAGASYDWNQLDAGPTAAGREWICDRLRQFLKCPFEVVGHSAAVRPILAGKLPVNHFLPEHSRLAVLNGLGSKGSLQAPLLSHELAEQIAATL